METNKRFEKIATASPETLALIDDVLEGRIKQPRKADLSTDCRLVTIAESCRMLGLKYPTFHRLMQAGCFDVVSATGKAMIRESSLHEYAAGLRKPSAEYLAEKEERNRLRRLARAGKLAKAD